MNHLKNERSPYLLQHASNPVDWYPWSEQAFEKARSEGKLIFLSIGYSSCHWCHVMENESFKDDLVARKMNKTFVSIKVDREEMPDIDNYYITLSQLMTGQAGWPLNFILSPEKKPLFAFTYIPRETRNNMIGMLDLCDTIDYLWNNKRDELLENANKAINAIKNEIKPERIDYNEAIENTFYSLKRTFDIEYGGFGSAPKFPEYHKLIFIMLYHKYFHGDIHMAVKTLTEMRLGGIYDHVSGGFHRYSTDSMWIVPHFEKMMYDQAFAVLAYTQAYQLTGKKLFMDTVHEITDFVNNEFFGEAFYTAIDADYKNIEGYYYTWDYNDIKDIIDDDFINDFNIKPEGNFISDKISGRNILYLKSEDKLNEKNMKILKKLKEKRVDSPFKDKKILCDVNGMAIKAFSYAYSVFKDRKMLDMARSAADFILYEMYQDGKLYHSYMNGLGPLANFDDHAFFISGLIELYNITNEKKYIDAAVQLNKKCIDLFYDGNGFFNSTGDFRMKEYYDSAVPSGLSAELQNLILLSFIDNNLNVFERAIDSVGYIIKNNPAFASAIVSSLIYYKYSYNIKGSKDFIENIEKKYVPSRLIELSNENQVCDMNKCIYNPDEIEKILR
ncbi:thioredoxin domain-containing protein [Picrophilus oshimae]|uniref:Thymidylate kinase n=1 Tax=Picrophilus torridus (strain ATCC 700027 / DSM 9790 / JCM 10055 / NBRC 100828 / KAW 2/3) TaxID=1122961 RepID=Q6KZ45_PICTO|nr:thioredoxin domain-containing protein [Picrophilus oshimae]AAT44007.1 thymidylate kinase [Picrophilus oshimae DSM 9789]